MIAAVRDSDAWVGTKLDLESLVLTATRSAEARLATWDEIDLVAMVWRRSGRTTRGEVIEAVLAHTVNQTEAAYARSDLFERRRPPDG